MVIYKLLNPYLPEVKAVPFAAPKVERVTANGIKKAAKPSTRVPKVYMEESNEREFNSLTDKRIFGRIVTRNNIFKINKCILKYFIELSFNKI